MPHYNAFRIHNDQGKHSAGIEQLEVVEPEQGEILIRTRYSSINYKDALTGTGRGKILHHFPLTGGIDSCGEVAQSNDPCFSEGDEVIVTGYGLSATDDGGYAEYLKVPAEWAVPMPEGLGPLESMALGTAGFTAALALHRMEANGQTPEMGPILVTGASGGVGSLAVNIFDGEGYAVTAVNGKPQQHAWLEHLGASEVITREQFATGPSCLGERGLGRNCRHGGRCHALRPDPVGAALGLHCCYCSGRRPRTQYHGDAVHSPWYQPARHQQR